ncbi:hypothetical protein HK098_004622 [Nowakowskiella sp. JEL0407]|nr:hypothetical protein HK098_004622 [Nowakowskiella sp. JEL0407]
MTALTNFPDLANSSYGGKVLFATDDFFSVAENMISPSDPVWNEEYTEFGKLLSLQFRNFTLCTNAILLILRYRQMDGWETRRKRTEGHDWCIIKLGLPGKIVGFDVDTAYFTGNHSPRISIQGLSSDKELKLLPRRSEMGTKATDEELKSALLLKSDQWKELLPIKKLNPGYPESRHNYFEINNEERWVYLRVNLYPDGGVARLRVFGEVQIKWDKRNPRDILNLACVINGGKSIGCSDAHFGKPINLISPHNSTGMYDGWETARNPERPPQFVRGPDGHLIIPGSHWTILKLGHPGILSEIGVDTFHFKGNYPESCMVEVCDSDSDDLDLLLNFTASDDAKDGSSSSKRKKTVEWVEIVPRKVLGPNQAHKFAVVRATRATHVKITIYPDGGLSRLRAYGIIN